MLRACWTGCLPKEDGIELLASGTNLCAYFALCGEVVSRLEAVDFGHDFGGCLLDLDNLGFGETLNLLQSLSGHRQHALWKVVSIARLQPPCHILTVTVYNPCPLSFAMSEAPTP